MHHGQPGIRDTASVSCQEVMQPTSRQMHDTTMRTCPPVHRLNGLTCKGGNQLRCHCRFSRMTRFFRSCWRMR